MPFRSHGITYRLCFPTCLTDRSGFKESGNRSRKLDLNNTNMTGTVLVFTTPSNTSKKSCFSTKYAQSIDWFKLRKSYFSRKRKLTSPDMDSFLEKLSSQGLSKESISIITNAERKGTCTHYESSWRKWDIWCIEKRLIPWDVLWKICLIFWQIFSWRLWMQNKYRL